MSEGVWELIGYELFMDYPWVNSPEACWYQVWKLSGHRIWKYKTLDKPVTKVGE